MQESLKLPLSGHRIKKEYPYAGNTETSSDFPRLLFHADFYGALMLYHLHFLCML